MDYGIGASVRRREDLRFTTGSGHYTADFSKRDQLTAYFIRSEHAHAVIRRIDTSAALAMPGVKAILTGADWAREGLGTLPSDWVVTSKDGSPMRAATRPPLTSDRVRYVGDAVAVILAQTLHQAKDAAEAIDIDYASLPCAPNVMSASAAGAACLHDVAPDNRCFSWELGDAVKTDQAFASAPHVVRTKIVNTRLIPNPMEPRAALADYDAGMDQATLVTTSQNPHVARQVLAGLGIISEHKLRVLAPDVGGGFGAKIFVYPEESVCLWAACKLRRPVRWVSERTESFLTDAHGRDHVTEAELALAADGTFLALRVRTKAALGAYLSTFAAVIPTWMYGTMLAGQYRTPAIHAVVDAYYTNTAPVDAYRGAGRPEACYVVERLADLAAKHLDLDPAEVRRRNFIPATAFPYQTPVAAVYDSGNYEANFNRALQMIDYAGFAKRRADSENRGLLRGIGISCYIECCGLAPSNLAGMLGSGIGYYETATIRMTPTGKCVLLTGSHSHGQGHETVFAQIVHQQLGIPYDDIDVVHGDTATVPYGLGTYGSRSAAVGGSAIVKACDKIIEKGQKIAGYMLAVSADEITFASGIFSHAGSGQTLPLADVAIAAFKGHVTPQGQMEPGLEESAAYDPPNFTYPAGTYICEVEVNPRTGFVRLVDFVAVDDFGKVINPMIVEGQVHGGLAQGIGQALFEQCVYDPQSGQLLTASFMDYCLPRADDFPQFRIELAETPCPHNPLGAKGCGEAGTVAAPPAVMNAVIDAIGIDLDMPATPSRVWAALNSAKQDLTL